MLSSAEKRKIQRKKEGERSDFKDNAKIDMKFFSCLFLHTTFLALHSSNEKKKKFSDPLFSSHFLMFVARVKKKH